MQVAVMAVGHVHFKSACVQLRIDYKEAVYLSKPEQLRGCTAKNLRVYVGPGAFHAGSYGAIMAELGKRGITPLPL